MCKGYIDSDRNVSRYLLDVNDRLNELSGTDEDVLEVRKKGCVYRWCLCTVCVHAAPDLWL